MKKLILILLCLVLCAGTLVRADAPSTDPRSQFPFDSEDGAEPRDDFADDDSDSFTPDASISVTVDGESVALKYDPSPQYSVIQNGMVQSSYYAYGSDGITLYELYICFPDTVRAGMIITPEYEALTNGDASVSLIVSQNDIEQMYYFSSLSGGYVYPVDSYFSISIEDIVQSDQTVRYSGSFYATLIALDGNSGNVQATLQIPQTPFSFSIQGNVDTPPSVKPTADPYDMRKV